MIFYNNKEILFFFGFFVEMEDSKDDFLPFYFLLVNYFKASWGSKRREILG